MFSIGKMTKFLAVTMVTTAMVSMIAYADFSVTDNKYVIEADDEYIAYFDEDNEIKLNASFFEDLLEGILGDVKYVTIIELPSENEGTLFYGKVKAIPLDSFKLGLFGSLKLIGTGQDSYITFIARDSDGNVSDISRLNVMQSQSSLQPKSEDVFVETAVDMKVSGSLVGHGDDLIYEILTAPTKGDIHYSSTNSQFVYTPHMGEKGSDSFTYSVKNKYGEKSAVSKVTIDIVELDSDVYYTDMINSVNHYAAIKLADLGIYRGERVAGSDFLYPSQAVSRGEFLVMLMNAAKLDVNAPVIANEMTASDEEIPTWMENYFSSAVSAGIIEGDGVSLDVNGELTRAQAAVMMCNVFTELTEGVTASTFSVLDEVPQWAVMEINACEQRGIMKGDGQGNLNANATMTREEAVVVISRLLSMQ